MSRLLCRLRHRWVEVSRITWKNDGFAEGKANQKCARANCEARRSVFLGDGAR